MINRYARASIIWAICSTGAISIPGSWIPRITGLKNLIFDSLSHFIIFLVLSFLLTKTFRTQKKPIPVIQSAILALTISSLYGFCLEILQIPIPDRAFEWSDAFANIIGAIFGSIIAGFWSKQPQKKL